MLRKLKASRGFTLIELMIVVAIIGILAAIAIPNFIKYQLRSKRSEGSLNVAGIRTAEISYQGGNDLYISTAALPATPTAKKAAWCAVGGCGNFDTLAWRPEGAVYFQYQATATDAPISFTVNGLGDIDADSTYSCWGYIKAAATGAVTAHPFPGATECGGCVAGSANNDQTKLCTKEDYY